MLRCLLFLFFIRSVLAEGDKCHLVNKLPSTEQCQFVMNSCEDLGIVNLFKLYYCTLEFSHLRSLLVVSLIVASLTVLFLCLGMTSSNYLCPNLSTISAYFNIPDNLSGLTLLAFGNGSPDILGTYSSFTSGNPSLAIGELIGAAFLITSFVIGCMALIHPFSVIGNMDDQDLQPDIAASHVKNQKLVFIRDLGFFISSIVLGVLVLLDGELSIIECCVLSAFYVLYVLVVVFWNWVVSVKRQDAQRDAAIRDVYNEATFSMDVFQEEDIEYDTPKPNRFSSVRPSILEALEFNSVFNNLQRRQSLMTTTELSTYGGDSEYEDRTHNEDSEEEGISQIFIEQYHRGKSLNEVVAIVLSASVVPLKLVLRLSIPVIHDIEDGDFTETYGLNVLIVQSFCAPLVISYAALADSPNFTVYFIFAILASCAISTAVYLAFVGNKLSDRFQNTGVVQIVLAFAGFASSIAWISIIANELINVLKFISVLGQLSEAIVGLTIFAMGNCIGDLISNITIARMGYPLMALAACFGGPLLNVLLGVGLNGLITMGVNQTTVLMIEISPTLIVSVMGLLGNLIFLIVMVPMNSWRFDRWIGICIIGFWLLGTCVNVIVELITRV